MLEELSKRNLPFQGNERNFPVVFFFVKTHLISCSVVSDSFVTPWAASSVQEIFQERALEWAVIFSSRGPS